MHDLASHTQGRPGPSRRPSRWTTAGEIALVLLLVAAVVAISAHAPSQTYSYSQYRWVGIAMGAFQASGGREGGSWLMPRNHFGEPPHKPQLYVWLLAPVLMATGAYHDFVFRLPTIAAAFLTAAMVYCLARRWYGRRVGLMAACLWATLLHMSKLMYVATTDMLLTMWITASILCVDRLLFHRAPPATRRRWLIGLWLTMILAALTKGWGMVNLAAVGGLVALAAALRPGFSALRRQGGVGGRLALTARLIGRRWWRACKAVRLGWGLLAMGVAVAALWVGMFAQGDARDRQDLWKVLDDEVWQRITGTGTNPPKASSTPAVAHLLYYALPASVFAIGALFLERPRRWFSRKGSIGLPLCWIVAVVVPFSLAHGSRPDYLLPCYAAVAMLGAWAVEQVHRLGRGAGRSVRVLRHVFAAAPVAVGLALAAGTAVAVWYPYLPKLARKVIPVPTRLSPGTWWVLCGLIPAGFVAVVYAVRASLRWQIRRVAAAAIVAMLGVAFLHGHVISRHASTRDGEKMIQFARNVRRILGPDEFAVFRAERIGAEVYLGRFGRRIADPRKADDPRKSHDVSRAIDTLNERSERWLITCDWGVVELGARRTIQDGPRQIIAPVPRELGQVRYVGDRIVSESWGQMYLIELHSKSGRIQPSEKPRTILNTRANRKRMSWTLRHRGR